MLWCLVATLVPGIRLWGGSFVRLWVVGLRNPIDMTAWNPWISKICNFSPQKIRSFFTPEKQPNIQNTDLHFCCQLATATHHVSQDFGQINDGMKTIIEELQGTILAKNSEDGHPKSWILQMTMQTSGAKEKKSSCHHWKSSDCFLNKNQRAGTQEELQICLLP